MQVLLDNSGKFAKSVCVGIILVFITDLLCLRPFLLRVVMTSCDWNGSSTGGDRFSPGQSNLRRTGLRTPSVMRSLGLIF